MRYLLNELRIGIEKHHVEVLDRVYRLQRLPILEPNHLGYISNLLDANPAMVPLTFSLATA